MYPKKAVIFDLYQTLIQIKTTEDDLKTYKYVSNWLEYKGIKISPKDLCVLYKRIVKEEYESSREDYPEVEIGRVFERILQEGDSPLWGLSPSHPARLADGNRKHCPNVGAGLAPAPSPNPGPRSCQDDLIKELALMFRIHTTRSLSILPQAFPVLKELQKKVRLALVSNAQRLFSMNELVKFGLPGYFETIVFSSDVKVRKPSPKIFRKALHNLDVKPENAIYIGDNLFDDIAGAQNAGMKAIWINHGQGQGKLPKNFDPPKPDAEVKLHRYSDLPRIILSFL